MRLLILVPAFAVIAAAPAPTPISETLRATIIGGAKSVRPENLVFDRVSKSVRHGGGTKITTNQVDSWNGKTWRLISIANKPATRDQREQHRRAANQLPVPGYHQLAPMIAAATGSITDSQGLMFLEIPILPAGSVFTESGDISNHLKAEARVMRRGEKVWIDQLRISQREPFKLNMLIKVIGFTQTIEYQIGGDGQPRLAGQASESNGTMFGIPGGESAQVTLTYR